MLKLARIAVANSPGAGLQPYGRVGGPPRPRYSAGTILGLYPDKPQSRNWGDSRYMFKRIRLTDAQVELVRMKRLKLADLSVVAEPAEVFQNIRYEGFVAQHHVDIWRGVVNLSLHMNEEQKQILAIAQHVRPNAMGPREIKRAFMQSAVILYKHALVKIAARQKPTLPEAVVYQAVKNHKRVALPKELVQEIMHQYSVFRGLIQSCEVVAKGDIGRHCTVTYDDKVYDLTSTGLVNAPEWEQVADVNPLDIDPDPQPRINTGGNQLESLDPLDPTCTVGDGKTYATIQAAVDAIPGALGGTGIHTVEIYAGGVNVGDGYFYDEEVNALTGFSGATNSNYIILQAMLNHNGQRNVGIIVRAPGGATSRCILGASYIRIIGLGLTFNSNVTEAGAYGISSLNPAIYDKCIIYDMIRSAAGGINYGFNIGNGTVRNCAVINVTAASGIVYGIRTNGTTTTAVDNCSILGLASPGSSAYGIIRISGTVTTRNCAVGGVTGNVAVNYSGTQTKTYCISEDASAGGGAGCLNNQDPDTDVKFANTTQGSEDIHLQSGSVAIGAGTDLSGTFTDDIDGDTRSAWDVGADEVMAAGGSNPALHTTMVMGAI